jgi:curved DNA-binding protein CbpA
MEAERFVNYYDVLGLSPGASFEAIGHRFRDLARRYHPDNQATGDRSRFDVLVEAHDILKDEVRRARYHEDHRRHFPSYSPEESGRPGADSRPGGGEKETLIDSLGIERDNAIQNNLLTLLYFRRRRNIREPGIGDAELERLSGCPPEHLEFHVWYLKAKGWIATGEDGLLAITIDGVERVAHLYRESANRLITDQS